MATKKKINHPIQPIVKDDDGNQRFLENKIVSHLYNVGLKHGCGLNEIADMQFSKEDRQQFAQLIGYSLCGYSELGYVDDDAYRAAVASAKKDPKDAMIETLTFEINKLRKALQVPMARLFGVHPADLSRNIKG